MNNKTLSALVEACEKEPIHIPGAMLVFDKEVRELRLVSQNAAEFLGLENPDTPVVSNVLPRAVLTRIRKDLIERDITLIEHGKLHYTAYQSQPYTVVDIERIESDRHFNAVCTMADAFARIQQCSDRQQLLDTLTQLIQELSGNGRVMIYKFDEEWNGKVVSESLKPGYGSFLGQHFPASDIPPQVRKLYEQNPIRVIPNVEADAVSVVPVRGNNPKDPVNMSRGVLRGVSPVHLQYLKNLSVAAATSVAIYREGKLWGLIACHNDESVVPDPIRRQAALRITEFASQRLWLLESYAIQDYQRKVHTVTDELTHSIEDLMKPHHVVENFADDWLNLLYCDGCVYVRSSQYVEKGLVPEQPILTEMLRWLNKNARHFSYWSTDYLKEELPAGWKAETGIAGLLAIPLKTDAKADSWLLFFRKEQIRIRSWAGRPAKSDEPISLPFGDVLSPRKSFERWEDSVRGRSLSWREAQIYAARNIAKDLVIVADAIELGAVNDRLNHLNAKLKYLAENDDLTGIYNRRITEKQLQREFFAAKRYKRNFSVLLMDVDNFKNINDKFGHNAGDEILKQLCETIQGVIREPDIFGRWGGEEFLIVAPETNKQEGRQLAERIRKAVEEMRVENMPPITVSIGVCEYKDDPTWDKLIDKADKAMYEAKQTGRNRVVAAS